MLLQSLQYARPDTVEEALVLLDGEPGARVLAGGQSILNVLKHRLVRCSLLVDVSRLEALTRIEEGADGALRIGACVTYDELERSALIRERHPAIARLAAGTVDQQVRCRGTIGGNVCYNDAASNFPPVLVAAGARLRVVSSSGPREVAAEDFFRGPFSTAVAQPELLESVTIPALGAQERMAISSVQIGGDSWALARACARVSANGSIQSARVVLGCVGPTPVRARPMEQLLSDRPAERDTVEAAAAVAAEGLDPPSDVHASGEYRRALSVVVAKRAVLEAIGKEAS